jgi:hypothetical protein
MCSQIALAGVYGVSWSLIHQIVQNKIWKHVTSSHVLSTRPSHLRKAGV